eukprot:scaffold5022_cov18-Tisochrysis_lutea.AAC.1
MDRCCKNELRFVQAIAGALPLMIASLLQLQVNALLSSYFHSILSEGCGGWDCLTLAATSQRSVVFLLPFCTVGGVWRLGALRALHRNVCVAALLGVTLLPFLEVGVLHEECVHWCGIMGHDPDGRGGGSSSSHPQGPPHKRLKHAAGLVTGGASAAAAGGSAGGGTGSKGAAQRKPGAEASAAPKIQGAQGSSKRPAGTAAAGGQLEALCIKGPWNRGLEYKMVFEGRRIETADLMKLWA